MPAHVGDFELTHRLGEGGMGEVYGGTKDGERVAVKVLRRDVDLTDRERRRFIDEATRMRRVSHPSIVPVLDAGTLPDGRPFLSMPLLTGETLAERIQRGPLSLQEAVHWFEELASALTALHEAGLVHRDIKPENVMLAARDRGEETSTEPAMDRAVLLDLGIAREVDGKNSTTTEEGRTRGTPAYMAPERFFGAGASVASDVYELAVVLYAMLTGKLPWSDESGPAGRLHPADPDESGAVLPRGLSIALLRALSTRPENRPKTALDFANEIRNAASGEQPGAFRTTAKALVGATEPAVPMATKRVASQPPTQSVLSPTADRAQAVEEVRWPRRRWGAISVAAGIALVGSAAFAVRARVAPPTSEVPPQAAGSPAPSAVSPSAAPSGTSGDARSDAGLAPSPARSVTTAPMTSAAPDGGRAAESHSAGGRRVPPPRASSKPGPSDEFYLDRH